MKIYKTLMFTDENNGSIFSMDTISHEGKLWLVPEWLSPKDKAWQTPTRIVCMETLQYQKMSWDNADYMLNYPVPKAVLDGHTTEGGFVVVERPNIQIPCGRA